MGKLTVRIALVALAATTAHAATFEEPFASTSRWKTPIRSDSTFVAPTTDISGYLPGLSSFGWAGGQPAIYEAEVTDPLVNLYYHPWGYTNVRDGIWERTGNSAEIEDLIDDGWDQNWAGYEWNFYSSTHPTEQVPPNIFKPRTAPYWSLQAYAPAGWTPTDDNDGNAAIWQPNGWVLEMHAPIVMGHAPNAGDIVANFVSYTDPTGEGDGTASGRRAAMIPNYAGVIRDGELTAELIEHALSIGLSIAALTASHVGPASAFDSQTHQYSGSLSMGSHFAIPPDVDIGDLGLVTTNGATVAQAAQTYGLYVVDATPGDTFVIFVEDGAGDGPGWSYNLENDLKAILAALRVVQHPATNTWSDCAGNTGQQDQSVAGSGLLCMDCVGIDCADTELFHVKTGPGEFCFDPNVHTEGADDGEINLRYCPNGTKPAANPEYQCLAMTSSPMTGTSGCMFIGTGSYYVEFTTQPGGYDHSRFTVQGRAAGQ
jgi:hypothetical protein